MAKRPVRAAKPAKKTTPKKGVVRRTVRKIAKTVRRPVRRVGRRAAPAPAVPAPMIGIPTTPSVWDKLIKSVMTRTGLIVVCAIAAMLVVMTGKSVIVSIPWALIFANVMTIVGWIIFAAGAAIAIGVAVKSKGKSLKKAGWILAGAAVIALIVGKAVPTALYDGWSFSNGNPIVGQPTTTPAPTHAPQAPPIQKLTGGASFDTSEDCEMTITAEGVARIPVKNDGFTGKICITGQRLATDFTGEGDNWQYIVKTPDGTETAWTRKAHESGPFPGIVREPKFKGIGGTTEVILVITKDNR